MNQRARYSFFVLVLLLVENACGENHGTSYLNENDKTQIQTENRQAQNIQQSYDEIAAIRMSAAKMDMWSRGAFAFPETEQDIPTWLKVNLLEKRAKLMKQFNPIKPGGRRNDLLGATIASIRGGSDDIAEASHDDYSETLESKLEKLVETYGSEFKEAIERNKAEHAEDCAKSCEFFYCAKENKTSSSEDATTEKFSSYSMGGVPPEDFADAFGFPLDLIKVSKASLFDSSEAANVVAQAEEEGLSGNEYKSGKYRLGGDWLKNLPQTRKWFNERLENTFFPQLADLFPEIISSPSVLRAHSVSLLKYNSSHPRTDVHIDNGILAMTIAMNPEEEYTGGGTYFEHMGTDKILRMDVGYATFRPGSVRHGGHRVTEGKRYILGAFLLLEDRVEHVRRLKNRGSDLRKQGDLEGAAKHFEWALAINPKCTTCLKDWGEVLHARKRFPEAEVKIREALDLLEQQDSDALFTLGLLLSEQGKDDESIAAYTKSVSINPEDAELCYNLGIKLGARGDVKGEMDMYERATSIDPSMGGAFVNWGTALAESGNMDEAENKFIQAATNSPEIRPKALINLSLVNQHRANTRASTGNLEGAKVVAIEAGKQLDEAKTLLDDMANKDEEMERFAAQFKSLRLKCYRLMGQIFAGMKDMESCEQEFRKATERFSDAPDAWMLLSRILEVMGKTDEAKAAQDKVNMLRSLGGAFN